MKKPYIKLTLGLAAVVATTFCAHNFFLDASSHREAPMIANDPLADNTDLYAFRNPDKTGFITIIANYVPFELPQGGPNYYSFGENISYDIHIKNNAADAANAKDDITYKFTFYKENQIPGTFFNILLGKQNLKTTYQVEKIVKGVSTIVVDKKNGIVPPNNIGPASISGGAGLNTPDYNTLRTTSMSVGNGGEEFFCGPADDPFFADLGGIFDLGTTRAGKGSRDGLAKYNVHSIAINVPIATLQKDGKNTPMTILDPDYVIGVWASASRKAMKTFNANGTATEMGDWVQVSRLGMPLTNEVINPIGYKDKWNSLTPYQTGAEISAADTFFTNPELANYISPGAYASAVPALGNLRIQAGFSNKGAGLFGLTTNGTDLSGTVFDTPYKPYLLRDKQPRSVDILPIFHTGVPNARPYQLNTKMKGGNPLATGKPFIHNFLPVVGDMLRLNMAVPPTPRSDPNFSSEGLLAAAVIGLTDTAYSNHPELQFIPNMDGFPNGRRLEDDVTRIELQAVSGLVLFAIGIGYDANDAGRAGKVIGYTTGVETNDTTFRAKFPFVQTPWSGFAQPGKASPITASKAALFNGPVSETTIKVLKNSPNPFSKSTTLQYIIEANSKVELSIFDINGTLVKTLVNEKENAGTYNVVWSANGVSPGTYIAKLSTDGALAQSAKLILTE